MINWFCCSSRKLSGTVCLQTLFFNLSNSINLSFLLQRALFLFHCYAINKMSPCTLSIFLSHFFLFIRSPFWYLYTVYSPLPCPLSISLCTMELFWCQSFSLRGNKRACKPEIDYSQPESTDTFSAGITLFHYWQSPFLSISVSKPINLSTSLSLYFFFPLSPPLTSSRLLLPFFLKAHSFHFS